MEHWLKYKTLCNYRKDFPVAYYVLYITLRAGGVRKISKNSQASIPTPSKSWQSTGKGRQQLKNRTQNCEIATMISGVKGKESILTGKIC